MKIHNLYEDENGESHFRDIEIEWVEERNFSKYSARLPANGIIFRETSGDYDLDWHPAPRRQYIINLDAGAQLTASDGETRPDMWKTGIKTPKARIRSRPHRKSGIDRAMPLVTSMAASVRVSRKRVPVRASVPPTKTRLRMMARVSINC